MRQSLTIKVSLIALGLVAVGVLASWGMWRLLPEKLLGSETTPTAVSSAGNPLPQATILATYSATPTPTATLAPSPASHSIDADPTLTPQSPESNPTPTPQSSAPSSPPQQAGSCSTLLCRLLRQLGDLSALPTPQETNIFQISSQDRVYLEHYWDYFNSDELFLSRGFQIRTGYDGQKEYVVLARTPGPGYVARIYFTHRQHNWALEEGDDPTSPEATEWGFFPEVGNIRIYFDDEAVPRIDMPVTEFFRGDRFPFLAPLVGHYGTSNGGNISYIPLPFRHSVLIATTGLPRIFESEVVQFQEDPGPFESFRRNWNSAETQELYRVADLWKNLGDYPYLASPNSLQETITIPAFSPGEIRIPGPAMITALHLYLPSGGDERVTMKVFWDGEPFPSIEVPLRAFFGPAEELRPYRSLLLGIVPQGGRNEFYSFFPMPFNQEARIVLENGKGDPLTVEARILYTPIFPQTHLPRLHAAFKQERLLARADDSGNDILVDLSGRGGFVGAILTMYDLDRSPLDPVTEGHWHFPYLESDVNIWIDGKYALPGTGIEGDFNAGYYYIYTDVPGRQWNYALSGNPWKDRERWGEVVSQYRFFLTDKIEFQNSLRIEVEHGFKGNNLSVTYSSTSFWYQDE